MACAVDFFSAKNFINLLGSYALIFGQVDSPESPETPEITEMVENFRKFTKYLTK